MIFVLLFFIIFLLIASYYLSNKDVFSPSVLLCCGYMLACISCIMNIEKWGVNLHWNTFIFLIFGISSFVIGEVSFRALHPCNAKIGLSPKKERNVFQVTNFWVILFTIFNIFVLILAFRDIVNANNGSINSFSEMMNLYRTKLNYEDAEVASTLVTQLRKFSKGSAYCFIFVFINNLFCEVGRHKFRRNIKYLFPVILYFFITLLQGGRMNLIALVCAFLFCSYYQIRRRDGWNKAPSRKFVKWLIVIFVAVVILFYMLKEVVGRMGNETFFDYITRYIGGSIQLLDIYLNSNSINTVYHNETFPGLADALYKLGLSETYIQKSLEFRYSNGVQLGNIYTGLRRYYTDFGYIGVFVIQFLYAYLFNGFYHKIRKISKYSVGNIWFLVFYSYSIFAILLQAMEDHFFIHLSIGYFIELMVVGICVYLIFKVKIYLK